MHLIAQDAATGRSGDEVPLADATSARAATLPIRALTAAAAQSTLPPCRMGRIPLLAIKTQSSTIAAVLINAAHG